ncbi:MAG: tetratricopeptide repeat protein [Candidatus Sulfobium sp.]|jgi:lipopolysaccharide biosynthesis regulator YciM
MGKLSVFIFVLFLAALAVFAIHNKELTTVTIPFDAVYELPKIALILLSSAGGALAMLLIFAFRDTKKFIDNIQFQKKQKRDIKFQELYSKALNSILAHKEDTAREALGEILAEEPDHIDSLLRLGDIYASEEDYQKANTYYQKARAVNPRNIETLFAIEELLEKGGRWSEALKYVEDILEIDEDNLTAMYRKRGLLEKQSKWDDLVYLQKAILKHEHSEKDRKREHQNLIGYKYEYGRHSLENNQLEKAKKAFKTVLRLDKDFTPATLGIAEVMLREGESEEAVNLLEKAYESTSSVIVLARLEDLLISLGEPSRIIRIYKSAISRRPNDPTVRFFLAKLFYRLEMIDDAIDTLSGLDIAGLPYPELHQLMGSLYMRRNQPAKAVEEYQKVVEIRKSLMLAYCCKECGFNAEEWSGRCPDCGSWNTYQFNLDGTCSTLGAGQPA